MKTRAWVLSWSRSRVIRFFSLEHPSRQSLIIRDFTRTHDDDGSNDDRRAAPGAHSGSPRRRVEVCATSPFIGLSVSNHSPRPLSSPLPLAANDDRYEMRRECQEILPGLILGPLQAAKSLDILQGLGVTHMCVPSTPSQLAIGWLIQLNMFSRVRSLYKQRLYSRRERGILCQTTLPGSLQIPCRGSR